MDLHHHQPPPLIIPVHSSRPMPRRSRPNFTQAPQYRKPNFTPALRGSFSAHSSVCPPSPAQTSHRPRGRRPPTDLVVGSSIVRYISLPRAKTLCFPGATVQDITDTIPRCVRDHPSILTFVVHVGLNDIKYQQSEKLKRDFTFLLRALKATGKQYVISGPFSLSALVT